MATAEKQKTTKEMGPQQQARAWKLLKMLLGVQLFFTSALFIFALVADVVGAQFTSAFFALSILQLFIAMPAIFAVVYKSTTLVIAYTALQLTAGVCELLWAVYLLVISDTQETGRNETLGGLLLAATIFQLISVIVSIHQHPLPLIRHRPASNPDVLVVHPPPSSRPRARSPLVLSSPRCGRRCQHSVAPQKSYDGIDRPCTTVTSPSNKTFFSPRPCMTNVCSPICKTAASPMATTSVSPICKTAGSPMCKTAVSPIFKTAASPLTKTAASPLTKTAVVDTAMDKTQWAPSCQSMVGSKSEQKTYGSSLTESSPMDSAWNQSTAPSSSSISLPPTAALSDYCVRSMNDPTHATNVANSAGMPGNSNGSVARDNPL